MANPVETETPDQQNRGPRLIPWILIAYLVTLVVARCVVFLIMASRIPDIYVYFGETHVHPLNFGIFLLAGVGSILVLAEPRGRARSITAAGYGIGLALTFDEFSMWLLLNDDYWQRASLDAVSIMGGVLGLIAVAPHGETSVPAIGPLSQFSHSSSASSQLCSQILSNTFTVPCHACRSWSIDPRVDSPPRGA